MSDNSAVDRFINRYHIDDMDEDDFVLLLDEAIRLSEDPLIAALLSAISNNDDPIGYLFVERQDLIVSYVLDLVRKRSQNH